MKRIISLTIALYLVLGSFSFCFAAGWSDSNIQSLLTDVSNIKTNIQNINNKLQDIKGYLYTQGHSIAYWVEAIHTFMNPILQAINAVPVDIDSIDNGLWKTLENNSRQAYLDIIDKDFRIDSYPVYYRNNPNGSVRYYYYNGDTVQVDTYTPSNTPILGALMLHLWGINRSVGNMAEVQLRNSTNQQNYVDWTDLTSDNFTPISAYDALNQWLSKIQAPVARLSYVLASDERLEAQQAAAANEEAVVDNFIDSTGNGSASPSDIGSISDLSSGYKDNFGSDASISGIFNIFNSNNMGWFSQETVNQLDTTQRSRSSYATPLLDQQIQDIYDQIGVKHD